MAVRLRPSPPSSIPSLQVRGVLVLLEQRISELNVIYMASNVARLDQAVRHATGRVRAGVGRRWVG